VNRQALEHLLRAAATITGESTFDVVRSAATLVTLRKRIARLGTRRHKYGTM
jgi:hypothetical protein